MNIQEKMNIALKGWVITGVGMIDRYRYLVVGQWDNDPEDEKNPYISKKDNKKYNHPTRMFGIDIENNKIIWNTSLDGLSQVWLDGGTIRGNKEAFFFGLGGVTYHLDYGADKFEHEELLGTTERIEAGTARGSRGIKLLGNHFYSAYTGNQIHRRDGVRKWTDISKTPQEYCKKLGSCSVTSLDGFNENEIYFSGDEGNLWYYNGKTWEKIFGMPQEVDFEYVLCSDDGKVYAIASHGEGVAVGRKDKFTYIPMQKNDPIHESLIFATVHYKGKIYASNHTLYEFRENHWVKANIPGLHGSIEHLASKDGMLFVGTPYSLKIYNGKETFTLYGEAREDAMLVTKRLLEVSADFIEKGHKLLDELEK